MKKRKPDSRTMLALAIGHLKAVLYQHDCEEFTPEYCVYCKAVEFLEANGFSKPIVENEIQ